MSDNSQYHRAIRNECVTQTITIEALQDNHFHKAMLSGRQEIPDIEMEDYIDVYENWASHLTFDRLEQIRSDLKVEFFEGYQHKVVICY